VAVVVLTLVLLVVLLVVLPQVLEHQLQVLPVKVLLVEEEPLV
jgi:hypothetical protein